MSSNILSQVMRFVKEEKEGILKDFKELVGHPSVSAKNQGIVECADYLCGVFERHGFTAVKLDTSTGRPAIYAEKKGAGKTVLLYNHYDVQPAEPLEEWETNPFELVEKDGILYGRGVADNKGEIIVRLAAVRAVERLFGRLPVTIKWLVEGEEEVGSPSISELIKKHGHLFKDAFCCLWEGGEVVDNVPCFYLGVKGMLYVELKLTTAKHDAHSMYAPIMENAAEKMVRTLAQLKNPQGRVRIPGFYSNIMKPTKEELNVLASYKPSPERLAEALGVERLTVKKTDIVKQLVYEPTCNIAGLVSGYIGPGSKTIVPSSASVKIDFRLVPNQDPEKILRSLKKMLKGFDVYVHTFAYPARIKPDHPAVNTAVEAAREVYGKEPFVLPNMFGTGPLYHFVKLGVPTAMLTSLAHPGSRLHAPNENIYLEHFEKAIAHHVMFFTKVGGQVS